MLCTLFFNKVKGQLIAIPARLALNASFDKDDEIMRNIIIAVCLRTDDGKKIWDNKAVESW